MTLGLALLVSTLLLRWQPFGSSVYPIAERLAKGRGTAPVLVLAFAVLLSVAAWYLEGWWRAGLALGMLLLLFAGRPLKPEQGGALAPPEQAELLARSLRRYFVPLPVIALGGIWGVLLLWWLRFTPLPGRHLVNRVLNLRLAQLVGLHYSLVRQSRTSLQWSLSRPGPATGSLYGWCLQFVTRTREELAFSALWKTFVSLRWQWLAIAILIRWWLGA
ncbi:MAG: hypothetical protein LAT62_16285 [Natronospirillum sp.]|uniref:hypothetical protein n=1 Tax=Natronospirillum sp. TaxID=2812955 RepID=UPI0025DCBAFA|nr:hypothetical protein [Natronospirillum sp.]MCH8553497.1 hypothetical protein [Natronospirillum sp.]